MNYVKEEFYILGQLYIYWFGRQSKRNGLINLTSNHLSSQNLQEGILYLKKEGFAGTMANPASARCSL